MGRAYFLLDIGNFTIDGIGWKDGVLEKGFGMGFYVWFLGGFFMCVWGMRESWSWIVSVDVVGGWMNEMLYASVTIVFGTATAAVNTSFLLWVFRCCCD